MCGVNKCVCVWFVCLCVCVCVCVCVCKGGLLTCVPTSDTHVKSAK